MPKQKFCITLDEIIEQFFAENKIKRSTYIHSLIVESQPYKDWLQRKNATGNG